MKRYLLPCSCTRRIEVAASQAGGSVRCPGCGADLHVPRLGRLQRFEVAKPSAAPARRGWGAAQACILAGFVIAAVSAATAGWLHVRRSALIAIDERAIAESVTTATADRVYVAWRVFETQGIARPPLVDEVRRFRQAESLAPLERIAWAAAAAGTALAVGAALVAMGRRRGSG